MEGVIEPEVVYEDSKGALIKKSIEEGLQKVHGSGDLLLAYWKDIQKSIDVNDMILHNFKSNQMHLHEAEIQYWDKKSRNQMEIERLQDALDAAEADEKGEPLRILERALERIDSEEKKDHKHMSDMRRASTGLAKEYRQCAVQKKNSVSMDKVAEFKLMVVGLIHSNVHDKETLNNIADGIRQASLALFPVSSDKDIG